MKCFSFGVIAGAAALAFSAAAADAQTIGFKLGASLANLSIDGTTGPTDWTTGFMGGGFVRFGFGRLGIQPELLWVSKGAEMDMETTEDETIKIEYIAVPILLHLPLTYGSSFAPYIIAGPEFAFDMGCKSTDASGTVDCDSPDLADPFERESIDIGLSAGGGFAFAMGPGALLLEGRYTWGLTDLTADQTPTKNRSAYILAGYSIPLGRNY